MERNMNRADLIEMVKAADLPELQYRVMEWWDEADREAEEMTELEYLISIAEDLIEDFTEDTGHALHEEYVGAKWLLKRTENGKRIPISTETFRPLEGFAPEDIENARRIIAEVRNTKAFIRKLKKGEGK